MFNRESAVKSNGKAGEGMKCFFEYIRAKLLRNIVVVVCVSFMVIIFHLYQVPADAIQYSLVVSVMITLLAMCVEYYFYHRSFMARQRLLGSVEYNLLNMEEPSNQIERDYQNFIRMIIADKNEELLKKDNSYKELKEYIMMWAHQIKTPITGLKLLLQQHEVQNVENEEDMNRVRHMREEIFAIESYVGMNLEYIRLDSLNADLSVEECSLEKVVKKEVHFFSQMFIAKKLSIQLRDLDEIVISDQKWLSFVVGQILSNALKYTKKGGIEISTKSTDKKVYLIVQDTGIGIALEDLPRIFEKAFTGFNGHVDTKATGIGLYLSKQILDRLGHSIEIMSEAGVGTTVKIGICRKP